MCSRCAKVLPLAISVYQDGLPLHYIHAVHIAKVSCCYFNSLRSGFSITNQIKFDLRLTWCSELIVDQLCFVFPWIFDLQLRDRQLADLPSTEPTLCQSDWLTADLNLPYCAKLPSMHCEWMPWLINVVIAMISMISSAVKKYILLQINTGATASILFLHKTLFTVKIDQWSIVMPGTLC